MLEHAISRSRTLQFAFVVDQRLAIKLQLAWGIDIKLSLLERLKYLARSQRNITGYSEQKEKRLKGQFINCPIYGCRRVTIGHSDVTPDKTSLH